MDNFTNEQLSNLIENIRAQGVAEGRFRAREELGEALDRIAEGLHHGEPYRFPYWHMDYFKTYGAQKPIAAIRPSCIELRRPELEAIRFWLCGPPKDQK